MGSSQYVEHNSIQVFLIHLLASNLLVFLLLLYQLWNEIFGGLFFGVFGRQSFLIICSISQLFCLPFSLLCLRKFYTQLSDTGAKTTSLFYVFFFVQGVAVSGLALHVEARALFDHFSEYLFHFAAVTGYILLLWQVEVRAK